MLAGDGLRFCGGCLATAMCAVVDGVLLRGRAGGMRTHFKVGHSVPSFLLGFDLGVGIIRKLIAAP